MTYVNGWEELSAIKYSRKKELIDVHPVSNHIAEAVYRMKAESIGMHKRTNSLVYAMITGNRDNT